MTSEDGAADKSSPTPDEKTEHFTIQGKLQAAERATLRLPDGTDVELDLAEQQQDGTADYNVWGIEDTEPGDGERTYRNRLRLFCDARIIGHSTRNDSDVHTFEAVAELDLDTEAVDEAIDQLEAKAAVIDDALAQAASPARLNDGQFRALLDLYMASDGRLGGEQRTRETIESLLGSEALRRDFDNWVGAYHEFDPATPKDGDSA